MRKVGIIPARYKSSRFPGKPLAIINGTPMIIHVARIVERALGKENTFVATEDKRIEETVKSFGYQVVLTDDDCLTGTDRVWQAAKSIDADVYMNIQGDEPMLNPVDILNIAREKISSPDHVVNGMCRLSGTESAENINIPKTLVSESNTLIYMSRLPIPGIKDTKKGLPEYWKQVCIYAFSFQELKSFGEFGRKAEFEEFEDIEILRFLELGIPVKMVETTQASLAVDIPEDIEKVETAMKQIISK
tara:strand:+ start:3675 stop:4415 length:741 start_codon:yes stop_codon:yes gene_type:complete